jgi:hypothetical protein
MNLRWDRDGDLDGSLLLRLDPAQPVGGVLARRPGEGPDEHRGAEFGRNRGFPVEKPLGPHTSNLPILAIDRPAEERVEVTSAAADGLLSAGRVTAIRSMPGASVKLCLRVDRLAGEGSSVTSYFLRNPLPAEELAGWTGIGMDKPMWTNRSGCNLPHKGQASR